LAKAIAYPRQYLSTILRRNGEDFLGEVFSLPTWENVGARHAPLQFAGEPPHAGLQEPEQRCLAISLIPPFELDSNHGTWRPQRAMCLSYEGLVGILFMLETRRIKDPFRRARVRAFRDWVKHLAARAMLTIPAEQLPIGLEDIVELRPGRETGTAVRQAAGKEGCSTRTLWRRVERARIMAGRPRRARRADLAETKRPEDAARVLGFLREHPRATGRDLATLATSLSPATLRRIHKEFDLARRVAVSQARGAAVAQAAEGASAPRVSPAQEGDS
jgi:hypothetical protein